MHADWILCPFCRAEGLEIQSIMPPREEKGEEKDTSIKYNNSPTWMRKWE